jgi:hypothetical protein
LTKGPKVADDDIDAFVEKWLRGMDPALSAEERADLVYGFVVNLLKFSELDKSDDWIEAFAKRVRARALWLKP